MSCTSHGKDNIFYLEEIFIIIYYISVKILKINIEHLFNLSTSFFFPVHNIQYEFKFLTSVTFLTIEVLHAGQAGDRKLVDWDGVGLGTKLMRQGRYGNNPDGSDG